MACIKGMRWSKVSSKADKMEKKDMFKNLNNLRTDLDGLESYIRDEDVDEIKRQLGLVMDSFGSMIVKLSNYLGEDAMYLIEDIDPDKLIED